MPTDPPERDPAEPAPKKGSTPALFGSAMGDVAPYLGLGIEIMIAMVFFVLLGYFADGWLGTSPWLLILGVVLSALATGATLWRRVREMDARTKRRKKDG